MYVYEMLGAELLSNLYDKLGRLLTNTEQTSSWQVGTSNEMNAMKRHTDGLKACDREILFSPPAYRSAAVWIPVHRRNHRRELF